jgi:hypothetical protein
MGMQTHSQSRSSTMAAMQRRRYLYLAKQKGLVVQRSLDGSWCITLPGGGVYSATDETNMRTYVKGY